MQKEKLKVWLPLLISLSMAAGMYIGFNLRDKIPGKHFFSVNRRSSLEEILNLIEKKYVDLIDHNALTDTAIEAVLSHLDPHSVYIPASELEDINNEIDGNFYGIGIEFEIFNDTLNVINVMKDGSAEKAGIRIGDLLVNIGQTAIAGKHLDSDSIRSMLRGNRGSVINVGLIREGKRLTIPVTRGLVPVSSVDASFMIDSTTGLIRLNKFSTQTYKEFMIALTGLKQQGLQQLILDLRNNGGGVLDEAVEIADEFLDGDKLITYTEGKHYPKKEYRCRRQGQFEKGTLMVLTDEGTASASEVLMGALQDWDRATIIGRRSFGKGLVQEQYDLSDNGALRLTVARYYTPTGRSIQRSYQNGEKAYYEEIEERALQNNRNSDTSYDKGKVYTTPSGKKLYGGGGITPDVFIPSDSFAVSEAYTNTIAKGTLNRFAFKWAMHHPEISKNYPDAGAFAEQYQLSESGWKELDMELASDSIENQFTAAEKKRLADNIKMLIARTFWKRTGMFEVQRYQDNNILKALELMK